MNNVILLSSILLKFYQVADGYSQNFTKIYFIFIVIVGHYYMLQLLLAVINLNLNKIIQVESFIEMKKRGFFNENFKEEEIAIE